MFDILKKQHAVESIALSEIVTNPSQPRSYFDEAEIASLGESIRQSGLIQPVSVRKTEKGYELIAGERRVRACRLIGRDKIEALVYDIGDELSAIWSLVENLQRKDLGPFEEAEAVAKLVALWNIPREEAAKRLGLAPSSLSNKLRLLKLEPEVRDILTKKGLSERHAREILRITGREERIIAAEYIARKELSVSETEKYIGRLLLKNKPERKTRLAVKDLRLFINTFEHAVEVMNSAGLCAVSKVIETEETITYSVSVPKEKAFRTAAKTADLSAAPACFASAPSVI